MHKPDKPEPKTFVSRNGAPEVGVLKRRRGVLKP
jgi:hypothetical protein